MSIIYPKSTPVLLTANHKQLDLSTPKVMGILNVTPDSFSDGGQFTTIERILAHCQQMIQAGVDIIDIGGESTRPNADKVSQEEELARVVPAVRAIREHFGNQIWLSLDTSNPAVMEQGINAGADIINDVRALGRDGALPMAAQLGVPVVLMHSRGEPDTMNDLAVYDLVLEQIKAELDEKINQAMAAGIQRKQIIVDVGMGFAKNFEQHRLIMQHLDELVQYFELPMLFGVSRKRFLGELLSHANPAWKTHTPVDRDLMGAGMSLLAVQAGASIVRVHDVAGSVQMLSMWQQLQDTSAKHL